MNNKLDDFILVRALYIEIQGTEMRFSMENGMFKMKIDIDHHGPRLMPNNCQQLDPPYVSLPTTFNEMRD
jgi:hypothetical protein